MTWSNVIFAAAMGIAGSIFAREIVRSLRNRYFVGKTGKVSRSDQPFNFWAAMFLMGVFVVMFLTVGAAIVFAWLARGR